MAKPFKFRYVNEIVGSFVLLTAALVTISIVVIGFSQRWFTPTQRVVLILPRELPSVLRRGTDVVIQGTAAGTVQDVGPTEAVLAIPRNFMKLVHSDSPVKIRRALGGVGDAYVEIGGGSGPQLAAGATLTLREEDVDRNPTELAQQTMVNAQHTMDDLRRVALPMLKNLGDLAQSLNDPQGNFQQALVHANHITTDVDTGKGVANLLLRDRAMADQLSAAVPRMNQSLAALQKVLADLQQASSRLPTIATAAGKSVDEVPPTLQKLQSTLEHLNLVLADLRKMTATLPQTASAVNASLQPLPGIMLQTQETMTQLQRLVRAAQRNWLIQPFVGPEAPSHDRLSGDRVAP